MTIVENTDRQKNGERILYMLDKPKIMISYSQDSDEHNKQVISFTNFLRESGYNCWLDQMFKQQETSIDFNEMMLKELPNASKVIIILTPNYKYRAEEFIGGVGKEFRIINEEILKYPTKYILVSFSPLVTTPIDSILPNGLNGREIIDLSQDFNNDYNTLFSKLSNKPIYNFSSVSEQKIEPWEEKILPFSINKESNADKKSVFSIIQECLIENKQILAQYGPNSLVALNNPLSNSVDTWKRLKHSTIIPNNTKIVNLLENNLVLLTKEEKEIFYKFKIHTQAFALNQEERNDSEAVPLFPIEFETLIFKEE